MNALTPIGSPFDALIFQSALRFGLNPDVFRRQLMQESRLNPAARSPKGAAGIAQFMPATAQEFGIDPLDPNQAIPAAAKYMRQHLDASGGDYARALAAYNWGPGHLQRLGLESAPPETIDYVNTILGANVLGPQADSYVNADGSVMPNFSDMFAPPPPASTRTQIPGYVWMSDLQQQQQPQQPQQPQPPQQPASTRTQIPGYVWMSDLQQQQPQQPQAQVQPQPQPSMPMPLPSSPQPQAPPPWYSLSDVFSSGQEAFSDVIREAMQTAGGQATTDQPNQRAQVPRSFAGNVTYGLVHQFPTIGAGFAGAAAGAAIPGLGETGIGEIGGAAAGMTIASFIQAIAPAYNRARLPQEQGGLGMTQEQAVNYAYASAATEGVINAVTAPLFAVPVVKSAIGNLLFHALVTQPAVGVGARLIEPAVTGQPQPTGQELAQGVGMDIASGLILGGATHLAQGRKAAQTEQQTKPRTEPALPAREGPLPPLPPETPPPDGGVGGLEAPPPGTTPGVAPPPGGGVPPPPSIVRPPPPEPSVIVTPPPPKTPAEPPSPPTGEPHVTPPPEAGPPAVTSPGPGDIPLVPQVGPQPPAGGEAHVGGGGGVPRPPTGVPPERATPATQAPPARPTGDVPVAEGGPGTTRVLTTQNNKISVPVKYEVVNLSQLKPATGDLQPRDRAGRAMSEQQIAQNAARLDPDQLMASPTADYGAPVVTPEGTILAGNGRAASIARAAEMHPEVYQRYVVRLKAAGHDVTGMNTPVLVRRTGPMSPEDQVTFARDSNVSRAMAMSPVEQAKVDSSELTDDMVRRYVSGNQQWLREWVGSLPASEQARVLDAKGRLSPQEGQRRLHGALLHKAYGSDDILNRALESPTDDTRNITYSLTDVAPEWAALRALIAEGKLPKEFDITPQLTRALDLVREQRERGLTPGDVIDQRDAFEGAIDPITEQLYRSFYNPALTRLSGRTKLTGVLKDYINEARAFKPGKDLFGQEGKPNPAEIIRNARVGEEAFVDTLADEAPPGDEAAPTGEASPEIAKLAEPAAAEGETLPPDDTEPDTSTAKDPANQRIVDEYNQRIDKLESIGKKEQAGALAKFRDELLAKGRRRPKRVSTAPPPSQGREKNFDDYKLQKGQSVWDEAFTAAGHNPNQAKNYPPEKQRDILRAQVEKTFGFKDPTSPNAPGVKIDADVDTYEAIHQLLDLHRAMQDMMSVLKFPNEMASIMGKATLNLHRAGPGKPLGIYDPNDRSIHLYGRANSFGHEWVHAFDHELAQTLNMPMYKKALSATRAGREEKLDPNEPLAERMGRLVNTLFYNEAALIAEKLKLQLKAQEVDANGATTPAAQAAQNRLDKMKLGSAPASAGVESSKFAEKARNFGKSGYWDKPEELLARAGEWYLSRIMHNAMLDPRGVLMPDEAYLKDNDRRLQMTFPDLEDQQAIFDAFEHLMDGWLGTALAGSPAAMQARRDGMSDPLGWSILAPTQKLGPFRETVAAVRDWQGTLAATALTDPKRPDPEQRHAWARAKATASGIFNSMMGVLEAIHHDTPAAAKKPLQDLMDRVGRTVGSGRYTGWIPLEERRDKIFGAAMGQFSNILTAHGLSPEKMTDEQADHLVHSMQTGDNTYPVTAGDLNSPRVPIANNVVSAAGNLRRISNDMYDLLKAAKVPLGYAKSAHYPRFYDAVRAHSDPDGFVNAVGKVYKLMFDREVGQPGDDPHKLLAVWQRLTVEEQRRSGVDFEMGDLAKTLRQQAAAHAAKDTAEFDRLQLQAEDIARRAHDAAGNHIAEIQGREFQAQLTQGYHFDFDTHQPGARFMNNRVLPPETDQLMRDWMLRDPRVALPHYYESASRKIAHAERFGHQNEVAKELFAQMAKGGMHRDDQEAVQEVFDIVTGQAKRGNAKAVAQFANMVHAGAALGLMPRTIWSMFSEPFTIALSTGHMRAGLHSFAALFSEIARTDGAKKRAQLAEFMHVVRSGVHDTILTNRTGADYSDSPKIGKFMAQFYRRIGVPQVNNANRRAAMVGQDWVLSRWSKDILDPTASNYDKSDAHRGLNEYGVDPDLHEDFAKWKAGIDGLPEIADLQRSRFGGVYSDAMFRMSRDAAILESTKMDRPIAAHNPWTRLLFQFLSYNYKFQRSVLDPTMRRVEHAAKFAYDESQAAGDSKMVSLLKGGGNAAWSLSHFAAIAGAYVAINMLTSAIRQYLFNQNDWKKHEKAGDLGAYITELAISRSTLSGTLDPIIQVGTNLRYTQDLSSLLQGPAIKWYTKNLYDVFQGFANPLGEDSGSNVRVHNAIKGFYNLLGTPLAAFIATKIGAFGPIGALAAGAGEQFLSSPQFAETVADAAVGPKGATPVPTGALPKLPEMPGRKLPKLGARTGPGSREGISDVQGAGAFPWGLADDFVLPAWRVAAPVFGRIPIAGKIAGAAALTGYGAEEFVRKTQKFRDAPPPKDKEVIEPLNVN